MFELTEECEDAFSKIKYFLMSPPILTRLRERSLMFFYLLVSDHAINLVLVKEIDKTERPMYFLSKVFKGAETRY